MKAKKFLSSTLKFVLLAVVAAFLALHSINLFTFVFPADQEYLAWLGFGLTGFGAVVYLLMFLWEGATVLQRSVSLAMAVICSIGEVLAAIFGMMIESWQKAGFTMTENDFQGMLLVIGALSIAHFFALIAYFAGDQIRELLSDADGDGIPNYRDNDYKKSSSRQTSKVYASEVEPIPDEVKAMYAPGTRFVDGTVGQGNGHKTADPTNQPRR
jgi:cation transport ATPase